MAAAFRSPMSEALSSSNSNTELNAGQASGRQAVISIDHLVVQYPARGFRQASTTAVNGLTLEVRQGEVFGFLGPNGAGKTSTMQVLLGFQQPTGGSASIFGVDVREPIARQRIGYLPELTYYYKFLN